MPAGLGAICLPDENRPKQITQSTTYPKILKAFKNIRSSLATQNECDLHKDSISMYYTRNWGQNECVTLPKSEAELNWKRTTHFLLAHSTRSWPNCTSSVHCSLTDHTQTTMDVSDCTLWLMSLRCIKQWNWWMMTRTYSYTDCTLIIPNDMECLHVLPFAANGN